MARLDAAQVQRQPGIDRALAPPQSRHHRLRVGHLRHPLGVDEADRFDVPQSTRRQAVDQFDPLGDAPGSLLALQAVARADLADVDGGPRRQMIPSFSSSISSSSPRPRMPPYTSWLWLPGSGEPSQAMSPSVSLSRGDDAGHCDVAEHLVLDAPQHAARPILGVLGDVGDRIDRTDHHGVAVENRVQIVGRHGPGPLGDHGVELGRVFAPRIVGRITLVVGKLRAGPWPGTAAGTWDRCWPR